VFLADDTIRSFRKGQAVVLVDDGYADEGLLLVFHGKMRDRSGGTNLTAERAVVFAVAGAWYKQGSKDSLEA
jgi:hypothetical protein